jgi:cytidyltransferase-like protein
MSFTIDPKSFWEAVGHKPTARENFLPRPNEDDYWASGKFDAERILSEACRRGAKFDSVIEYGSGDGRIARYVAPNCNKLTCVDVAQSVLDLAKAQLTDRFHLENVEYALADDMPKCDFLYSLQVLQHNPLDEQKRIMKRIHDSLKPGGLACVHFAAIETKPGYENTSTCTCFTKSEVDELAKVFDSYDVVTNRDHYVWGRKKESVIGYAYVVADLFHIGHLAHLERCKNLCDKLIVGVLTDEATQEKKRPPIIPFDERLAIVSALKCVDEAIKQETYSPLPNAVKLDVDILFESTSHTPEAIEQAKSLMPKVEVMPYYDGQSSTKIKQKVIREWS